MNEGVGLDDVIINNVHKKLPKIFKFFDPSWNVKLTKSNIHFIANLDGKSSKVERHFSVTPKITTKEGWELLAVFFIKYTEKDGESLCLFGYDSDDVEIDFGKSDMFVDLKGKFVEAIADYTHTLKSIKDRPYRIDI